VVSQERPATALPPAASQPVFQPDGPEAEAVWPEQRPATALRPAAFQLASQPDGPEAEAVSRERPATAPLPAASRPGAPEVEPRPWE
jgi:hypothetical protein